MSDTLEFQYALDPAEQAHVTALVEQRAWGAWLWVWYGLPFVLLPLAFVLFQWPLGILWPFVLLLAFAIAAGLYLLVPVLRRRHAARTLEAMPHMRVVTYRFDEESIHLTTSVTNASISWNGIREATETKDMFLLYLAPRFAYYVPKRVVGGREAELRRLLKRCLGERAASIGSA